MLDLKDVGAFPAAPTAAGVAVRFGIYLPGINAHAGYDVKVRVIHKDDRFAPEISTMNFSLSPVPGSPNNLWQAEIILPVRPGTSFGKPGTYLYRYQLLRHNPTSGAEDLLTLWFTDPFARHTDNVGQLSSFVTPDANLPFVWEDDHWKVPEVEDLIVYELHVEEFNGTFDGIIERLSYLKSLGISCLELMPITSLKLDFDWGSMPTLGRRTGA